MSSLISSGIQKIDLCDTNGLIDHYGRIFTANYLKLSLFTTKRFSSRGNGYMRGGSKCCLNRTKFFIPESRNTIAQGQLSNFENRSSSHKDFSK